MTQDPQKTPLNELPQVYDASLKNWIMQQAPDIVSILLPGARYEATLDIEAILPPMRMDRVFKIVYHRKEHILHLEFEVKDDRKLPSRLLVYNAVLYHKHRLPVMTIVIYPFSIKKAVPPLHIPKILTFHFKTLALFELNAEKFVRAHHVSMYPLLPTMKNVHAKLIDHVLQELVELYRDDEVSLSQQILWLKLLLERTDTVSLREKEQIKERLNMFDQLFEESPMIQQLREKYREQGLEQGRQQGRQQGLQVLQDLLVDTVQAKYPDLAALASQQAGHFDQLDTLKLLIQQIMTAPDADTVCKLLETSPEV